MWGVSSVSLREHLASRTDVISWLVPLQSSGSDPQRQSSKRSLTHLRWIHVGSQWEMFPCLTVTEFLPDNKQLLQTWQFHPKFGSTRKSVPPRVLGCIIVPLPVKSGFHAYKPLPPKSSLNPHFQGDQDDPAFWQLSCTHLCLKPQKEKH